MGGRASCSRHTQGRSARLTVVNRTPALHSFFCYVALGCYPLFAIRKKGGRREGGSAEGAAEVWRLVGASSTGTSSLWAARSGQYGSRSAARPISTASAAPDFRIFFACFGLVMSPTAVVGMPRDCAPVRRTALGSRASPEWSRRESIRRWTRRSGPRRGPSES